MRAAGGDVGEENAPAERVRSDAARELRRRGVERMTGRRRQLRDREEPRIEPVHPGDDERGARDVASHPKTPADALGKGRLSRAEISVQQDEVTGAQQLGERRPQLAHRLGRGHLKPRARACAVTGCPR